MLIPSFQNLEYETHEGVKKIACINFVKLDDFKSIKSNLENTICEIVNGQILASDLSTTKKVIKDLISGKTSIQKHGLVAEFFVYFVLKELGFVQESVFSNLEETSMKKGFDGLYSKNDVIWLSESKSGNTNGLIHKAKLQEAFTDLKNKLEGKSANNPFRNAACHMLIARKSPSTNLLYSIKKLSEDYTMRKFHELDQFCVVPASTLFVNHAQSEEDIKLDILNLINKMKYCKILIICIDNAIFDDFMTYIGI